MEWNALYCNTLMIYSHEYLIRNVFLISAILLLQAYTPVTLLLHNLLYGIL